MSTNELSFAMLGSTGAGKTTLLACMNKELEKLNPGTFFPADPKTFSTLNKAYNALKDEANDRNHYEFGVPVNGTEALSEYVFTIRGNSGSSEAKFIDFPGGWMNPEDQENYSKVEEVLKKSMVIIAAVNMPYLMEANGKHKERARIPEMINLLKSSLEDNSQDKLFLIVPIKCEKYTLNPRDTEKLHALLAQEFAEIFGLQDNPSCKNRLAVMVLPVHTAGNVYFSRFDKDGREIYTKNRDKGFSPKYVDQPLRAAMSFLLGTSPKLASDTALHESADYIRQYMELDNHDFRVICGRNLLLGLKNDVKHEPPVLPEPPIKPVKPKSDGKYTLAIMGATGAGKTVFLLSYFHLSMQLGRGKHTISISSEETVRKITSDIDSLINKGKPPMGTSIYDDMSFTASDMNIDLLDVPGGDTQLLAKEIPDRLRTADGAIFFIDGENLVNHPEKVLSDNIAFGKAISMLRENTFRNIAGKILGRKDIPIWFVITKCDAIPAISDEELQKHISALLRNASDNKGSGKWAEKLFKKGKRVKIFRTQSMGKWLSNTTPPNAANFNPVNVVEAMDSLIDEMQKSEKNYVRLVMAVLAGMVVAGAFAFAGFTYYTVWQTDHILWHSMMGRVERALVQENYREARKEIDEFISPSYMGLYLKSARADSMKDSEAYPKLEEALFTELTRRLSAINYDIMPEINAAFLKTQDLIAQYLDVKQFQTIAKSHYEQIKSKEWYFRAASNFGYIPGRGDNADDVMRAAEKCLNREYSTPESWREMENVKLEGILRTWINMLPNNVDMPELDIYINNAERLANNPSMPQNLRGYLHEQTERWKGLKSDQWRQAAEEWITEALRLPVQDSIRAINVHIAKTEISEAARERLKGAIDELYLKQADELIAQALELRDKGNPEEGVRILKARAERENSPVMKARLERELETLRSYIVDSWIEKAEAQELDKGIAALVSQMKDKGISESDKLKLDDKINDLERRLIVNWLNDAGKYPPEDRIAILSLYYEQSPTENVRDRIQREIGSTYNEIVNTALNQYPDDVQKLRELIVRLGKGQEMPAQVKEFLQNQITAAENKEHEEYLRAILQRIGNAATFGELRTILHDSDIDVNNHAVQLQISSSARKLLGNELAVIQSKASDYVRAEKFSEARKYAETECVKLRDGILSSVSGQGRNAIISQFEERQKELLANLSAAHLRICRSEFEANRRSGRGITETLAKLNAYLSVWPDSQEADTVSRVVNYLNAIENGITGYFEVVSGNFSNEERWNDTPDIYVRVSGGVSINIPEIRDQARPNFNGGNYMKWRPNTPAVKIVAYDAETIGDNRKVFDLSIDASGWDGWKRLTGRHTNRGNSIYTRFDVSVPSCPW